MLPTYEKVLETAVKQQIEKFAEQQKIFIDTQSGFRKRHSCETSLNTVLKEWKDGIERKNNVIAVFLDFKRAFETIVRSKLVEKLKQYGIGGIAAKWFESYLDNRRQKTRINEAESTAIQNDLGVPQGSVLGALLFILYINDIGDVVQRANINLFADDTMIYVEHGDLKEAAKIMNEELQKVTRWLYINKLKLNVDKTKYMIITNKKNNCQDSIDIQIEDAKIQCVESIKYLGVMLDNKMNFKNNADYVCKKVAKKIGYMARLGNKLNYSSKVLVYNSIIAPHFDYCSTILMMSNDEDHRRMQRLQNRAMRIILKARKRTPIDELLSRLKWLSVKQKLVMNALLTVFKMKNEMLPQYHCHNIITARDIHGRNLRNADDYRLPVYRLTASQEHISYKGLKFFNGLPNETKQETNFKIFKGKCEEFVREKIKNDTKLWL
jgi:hypothetical protein